MATVTKESLETLFRNIDSKLEYTVDIYIIGGASAILGYNIVKQTDDVDLDGTAEPHFQKLFNEASHETGTDLVLSSKGVFTPPDGYRERMHFKDFPRRKLRIWFLDKDDFAISKISRGFGKDYEDISKVHEQAPYEYASLMNIFMTEFIGIATIGNEKETKMNFLDLVEKLFGSERMIEAKRDIKF
ncbi:MAG TPA: DUF6036 family nucleotidyltransferase [Pseudobdellovibrionaceae bacterium]|jgi:hypothetical protein